MTKQECICDCHFRESIHKPSQCLCNNEPKPKLNSIEEVLSAFDKKFTANSGYPKFAGDVTTKKVKAFIRQALVRVRRETIIETTRYVKKVYLFRQLKSEIWKGGNYGIKSRSK